jgi:hypothetical protein
VVLKTQVVGNNGTGGVVAEVTRRGQLITAPIQYSSPFIASLIAVDTAYNLVFPETGKDFVITDLLITGTKSIDNVIDATVIIYEADSEDTLDVLNTLFHLSVPRSGIIPMTGLNVITENNTKYINIKTSDATVNCTLMGYYLGKHHEI